MICPICTTHYSAHDIEWNGELLSVCNACFKNRPDDAISHDHPERVDPNNNPPCPRCNGPQYGEPCDCNGVDY